MPFYDNFLSLGQDITVIGKIRIASEIASRIKLIDQFWGEHLLKVLEYGPGKGHFIEAVSKLQWDFVPVDGIPTINKRLRSFGYSVIGAFVPPVPLNLPDYGVVQ